MFSYHPLSGETINGCFTKKGWQADTGTTPKSHSHKEVASLADCALYCFADLDWCDGFNFLPKKSTGKSNCFPRQGAKLKAKKSAQSIAGWCPKKNGNLMLMNFIQSVLSQAFLLPRPSPSSPPTCSAPAREKFVSSQSM